MEIIKKSKVKRVLYLLPALMLVARLSHAQNIIAIDSFAFDEVVSYDIIDGEVGYLAASKSPKKVQCYSEVRGKSNVFYSYPFTYKRYSKQTNQTKAVLKDGQCYIVSYQSSRNLFGLSNFRSSGSSQNVGSNDIQYDVGLCWTAPEPFHISEVNSGEDKTQNLHSDLKMPNFSSTTNGEGFILNMVAGSTKDFLYTYIITIEGTSYSSQITAIDKDIKSIKCIEASLFTYLTGQADSQTWKYSDHLKCDMNENKLHYVFTDEKKQTWLQSWSPNLDPQKHALDSGYWTLLKAENGYLLLSQVKNLNATTIDLWLLTPSGKLTQIATDTGIEIDKKLFATTVPTLTGQDRILNFLHGSIQIETDGKVIWASFKSKSDGEPAICGYDGKSTRMLLDTGLRPTAAYREGEWSEIFYYFTQSPMRCQIIENSNQTSGNINTTTRFPMEMYSTRKTLASLNRIYRGAVIQLNKDPNFALHSFENRGNTLVWMERSILGSSTIPGLGPQKTNYILKMLCAGDQCPERAQSQIDAQKQVGYYNPGTKQLNVRLSDTYTNGVVVQLFDMNGKQLPGRMGQSNLGGTEISMDLSTLAQAIYVVVVLDVTTGKVIHTQKIGVF